MSKVVVIKDFKMPQCCADCDIEALYWQEYRCGILNKQTCFDKGFNRCVDRLVECPLKEVEA